MRAGATKKMIFVKPENLQIVFHDTYIEHISRKNKNMSAKIASLAKNRANVPAARMSENATLSVTNEPLNTVRPDRTQTKPVQSKEQCRNQSGVAQYH